MRFVLWYDLGQQQRTRKQHPQLLPPQPHLLPPPPPPAHSVPPKWLWKGLAPRNILSPLIWPKNTTKPYTIYNTYEATVYCIVYRWPKPDFHYIKKSFPVPWSFLCSLRHCVAYPEDNSKVLAFFNTKIVLLWLHKDCEALAMTHR